MDDARLRRGYWQVVAAEVIAIVAGNVALGLGGHPAYAPAWTLLVVGVHFLPLARMFRIPGLTAAGLVLAAAAAGAAAAARPRGCGPAWSPGWRAAWSALPAPPRACGAPPRATPREAGRRA